MKIVIIGAGSMAFTPALLGGFSGDKRYRGATIGLGDVNAEALEIIERLARRVSEEFDLHWMVQASTKRRDVLAGADIVTTAIGVGGLRAWELDVQIPAQHGFIQPVADTSGPGGLGRALRHIPVLVGIARDMEALCPQATLYNFSNPLTVITQAVNKLSKVRCIGLCIGVDLTWNHLCRVLGVDKARTSIVAGGINHCHWILDLRLDGEDAFPVLSAALDEVDGNPEAMSALRRKYAALGERPLEPFKGAEPVCTALYRQLGYYPGPGDFHVVEFLPQFTPLALQGRSEAEFNGAALAGCQRTYPELMRKMTAMAERRMPLKEETFGKELAWEHTQLLDILASQQDNLGKVFYVNLPNRGYVHNLPEGAVVETPVRVDAGGLHPFALGDLPLPILSILARKVATLDLIIEAAMEGSRRKAMQAFINDPYCTDMAVGARMVNDLIDAELAYLPAFR
jgi:alpha-galactosidase